MEAALIIQLVTLILLYSGDMRGQTLETVVADEWRMAVQLDFVRYFRAFAKCAQMLFSIPAGSAPSERSFSSTGRIYSNLRNSLEPAHLEMLVVCRDYIKGTDSLLIS